MRSRWMGCAASCLALVGTVRAQAPATPPLTPTPSTVVSSPFVEDSGLNWTADGGGVATSSWVVAEYIAWAGRGDHLPPLITASPAGTPITSAGVLGAPGTVVLFGNKNVDDDLRSGFRVAAGTWLDECGKIGIEASVFYLDPTGEQRLASGNGLGNSAIVSRPFVDATTGRAVSELVAFPGVLAGSVRASSNSDVWGGDFNGRYNLCCGCAYRLDALAGFRYFRLADTVGINEDLTATNPVGAVAPGTRIQVADRFRTVNNFYGGQIGVAGEYRFGRVYVDASAKIAFGDVNQRITINGATAVTPPGGATVVRPGGLLAQATNSGNFHRDDFAVLPEFGFHIGYQLTDHLRTFVGYNFLELSQVTRPGNVIDLTVNTTQLPPGTLVGPARPTVLGSTSDYWLQGISAGVEVRF